MLLYKLRNNKIYNRKIFPVFDHPIPIKIDKIAWKVWVRSLRDISWIFKSRRILENSVTFDSLFLAINKTFTPQVFWDIGANIGFYTWLLMSSNYEMESVLFEPDPNNISLLQKTLKYSHLTKVKIVPNAISNLVGEANFAVDLITGATGTLETPEQTFIERYYGEKPKSVNVQTITLDSLLDCEHINSPDLIKIDVEGAEHKVFDGGMKLIAKYQPIIIFECSKKNKQTLLKSLAAIGYINLNADRFDGSLEGAYNVLALPNKYAGLLDELLNAWLNEKNSYSKYIYLNDL